MTMRQEPADDLGPAAPGRQSVDVEKVLQAATALFAAAGYEAVGTREIAKSSGCHVPSLYYHFKSKEQLYRESCEEKSSELVEAIEVAIAGEREPRARLRAVIDGFYDRFTGDRDLFLLYQRDTINAAVDRQRFLFAGEHEHFKARIRTLAAEVVGREIDEHIAFMILSLIFGYCCGLLIVGEAPPTAAQRKAQLFEMILRMLGQ